MAKTPTTDSRFSLDDRFQVNEAGPSRPRSSDTNTQSGSDNELGEDHQEEPGDESADDLEQSDGEDRDELEPGMDPEGFAGPTKTVKPLTPEALASFRAKQERAGVVYISRIPPGMRPSKVRHLMSQYGEVGRVYLQQEGMIFYLFYFTCYFTLVLDAKRAYLRKKYTATKKAHFTEGWVEFTDKRVARSVADMLNAQPIGGKKGTRWRDDVWTMKYLPRFKWNMLTEQIGLYLSPLTYLSLLTLFIHKNISQRSSCAHRTFASRARAVTPRAEGLPAPGRTCASA